MEDLDTLFGGEAPGLALPPHPGGRGALPEGEVRALALASPLPPPRRKVLEGLALLWHDHWDAAHAVAQAHEGQSDHDLLHAFGHRREGDYANADYWFRSAGRHPAFARLAAAAGPMLEGSPLREALLPEGAWSTRAFTAAVRRAVKDGSAADLLVRLQALELRAFAQCLISG